MISNRTQPSLITPDEINYAVIVFHEILLKKDLYPLDQDLLQAARMTSPIIDMAISLQHLMDVNRESFLRCHSRQRFPTYSTEFFLHRSDMSTYVEENNLFIDFGNREGSIGEAVTEFSSRFIEYKPFIREIKQRFCQLRDATNDTQFGTKKERDFVRGYDQCRQDMEHILLQLVDAFQLNFMDPRKLIESDIGQRLLREPGTMVLRAKIDRLQEYLDTEFQIARPP